MQDFWSKDVKSFEMFESNLFYSIMVDGKYEFLKNYIKLHINLGDIVYIFSSILTIKL